MVFNKPDKCVQEDLKLPMKPFHFAQSLFVCARYKINYGVITANSLSYDIVSIIVSLTVISAFVYSKVNLTTSYFVNIGHIILVSIGYFMMCCNNIIQKHNNVLLAILTQKLQSFFKNKDLMKRFTIHNWICVIIYFVYYTFVHIYFYTVFGTNDLFDFLMNYCIPLFEMSVLHAAAFMKFLWECLGLWLEDVQKSDFSVQWTRDWDKMFEVYMDLLNIYKLTEQTFGPIVS